MPWEDPIVAEVHRARQKLMEECNDDIDAYFDGVMKRQAALGEKLVSPKPRVEQAAELGSGGETCHVGVASIATSPAA